MSMTILIASAFLAQSAPTAITVTGGVDHIDVAAEELVSGHPQAAIEKIRANRALDRDDPAALINLGAAYARLGDGQAANDCYRDVLVSSVRYDLELIDGRWMDSRSAARLAMRTRGQGRVLALR